MKSNLLQLDKQKKLIDSRYCLIEDFIFKIYDSNNKNNKLFEYPLHLIENVTPPMSNSNPIFEILLKSGNTLYFKANNLKEAQEWSMCLLEEPSWTGEQFNMDDFKELNELGRGLTSKVIKALCLKDQKIYAIKSIRKDSNLVGNDGFRAFRERNVLMKLNSPFIVQFFGSFQTSTRFQLVLEYIPGGNLRKYLQNSSTFSKRQIKLYLAECALALSHLHDFGLVYRDLKPENILITEKGHIKLTDFGMTIDSNNLIPKSFSGTQEYAAPELLSGMNYTKAVDWWSLGVLAYELIVGHKPFIATSAQNLSNSIITGFLRLPSGINYEETSFITSLLEKNPKSRLGYNSFHQIKNHSFFSDINWNDLYFLKYQMEFLPQIEELNSTTTDDSIFSESFSCSSSSLLNIDGFTFTVNPFNE